MDISDKKSLKRDYRVYGVDIARILSMLMVVFLHNLLAGGILRENDTSFSNLTYWLVWRELSVPGNPVTVKTTAEILAGWA